MVANQFLDSLNRLQCLTYVGVDDFADKLNFLYTVIIFLICISTVTIRQYVLKPISCYMSTDVGGINLLNYLENYCWIEGTVPISYNGSLPITQEEWKELENYKILYYQWVPFVLSLQCILFYIPHLIWLCVSFYVSGTDLHHLITSANQAVHSSEEARQKMIKYVSITISDIMHHQKNRISFLTYLLVFFKNKFDCSDIPQTDSTSVKHFKCLCIQIPRILVSYLIIKLLFLSNIILQLFIMQCFLGLNSISSLGLDVLNNIIHGRDWQVTLIFPRVAFCYVPLNHLGTRNNGAAAQCVLPVNMLNEKIFIFLWHWALLCFIVTLLSFFIWLTRLSLSSRHQCRFIRRKLILNQSIDRKNKTDRIMVQNFVGHFLQHDGIFLLKMIEINAGGMLTGDIVCYLWQIYREEQQKQQQELHDQENMDFPSIHEIQKPITIMCDGDNNVDFRKSLNFPLSNGYVRSSAPPPNLQQPSRDLEMSIRPAYI